MGPGTAVLVDFVDANRAAKLAIATGGAVTDWRVGHQPVVSAKGGG